MKKNSFFASTQTKFMTAARTLLTAILLMTGINGAWAQASYNVTYTEGVAIGDVNMNSASYFLYNIGTGKFLTEGMDYGTRGTVDHAGRVITFASTGDGTYSLYTNSYSVNNNEAAKAGYLTKNGYVDTGTNDADWVFSPVNVSGYTNAYTIKENTEGTFLRRTLADNWSLGTASIEIVNLGANTEDEYSYWLIIPKMTRDYHSDKTYYLQNTDFNRPWERMIWTGTFTNKSGGNPDNRCAESWHANLNTSQAISAAIPNATYQLYAQGFYADNDGNDVPYLYANSDQQPLAIRTDANINSMAKASTEFSAGSYVNSLTTNVTNNALTVGINTNSNTHWVIFDNFALKQFPIATTSGSALGASQWHAYTIDAAGQYVITSSGMATLAYTQTGTDGFPDITSAISRDVTSAISIGPIELEPGTLYVYSSAAVTLTLTDNLITSNPSFEVDDTGSLTATNNNSDGLRGYGQAQNRYQPTGWTVTGDQSVSLLVTKDCYTDNNFGKVTSIPNGTRALYLRQQYDGAGSSHVRTNDITLDPGAYKMAIKQRTAYANNATSSFTLVAGSATGDSKTFEKGSNNCFTTSEWTEDELYFYLDERTTLQLGVDITWKIGGSCIMIDDLRVSGVSFSLETREMRRFEEEAQDAAYDAYLNEPNNATITALKKAIADATYSADCYAAADATIAKVNDLLGKTNVYTYEAYNTFDAKYNEYKRLRQERTLSNDAALQMERDIFGQRLPAANAHHMGNIAVVPFLGSAWDDNGDYTWSDYWVNTWSNVGDDDGSQFVVPFIEYLRAPNGGDDLPEKTMTATIPVPAEGNYTVYADAQVRKRNGASQIDLGKIKMEVGNTAIQLSNDTYGARQSGSTPYYLTNPTTNRLQVTGAATQNASGDYELKIKFIVENGSGASWLAFQNVWVDFSGTSTSIDDASSALTSKIDECKENKIGFWFGEYTPWRNIEALKTLEDAIYVRDNISNLNPAFVQRALDALNNVTWIPNGGNEETNGFFWRNDYSNSDKETIQMIKKDGDGNNMYDENGNLIYETVDLITPQGWGLGGRTDGYNTRISNMYVNSANDKGLIAVEGETVLMTKYDTNYGEQTGYTLPLKPGTKYSLTFLYTLWAKNANEALSFRVEGASDKLTNAEIEALDESQYTPIRTEIVIYRKGDKEHPINLYFSSDNQIHNYLSHENSLDINQGNFNADKWFMVRAYFTTANPDTSIGHTADDNEEYVIEFNKTFKKRQIQLAFGELYLLRYRENTDVIDGKSTDFNYKYEAKLHAQNVNLRRALSHGEKGNTTDGHYWNSLCLPFKMSYKEVQQNFGVDELFYYTGTSSNYVAETNTTYVTFNFEGSNSENGPKKGIIANIPVFFPFYYDSNKYPGDEATYINYVIKDSDGHPTVTDRNNLYDFVGTYETMKIPAGGVYISKNNEFKVSAGGTGLQPTRAYFRKTPSAPNNVKVVGITIDETETAIAFIEEDGSLMRTSGNIYTIDGRLVRQNATSLRGLPRGIYVLDGRKFSVQ